MIFFNDKISVRQLQILLILNIFGTGVLSLPRIAALHAEQDGYVAVIIAGVLASFFAFIIATVARRFPNESFYGYCGKLLTRPIAFVLSMGFVVKLIINLSLELRFFEEVVRQTLLETTPFWTISLLMLAIGGYAASKGYETRARLGELLVLLVFIPILFVFVLACFKMDIQNVMPFFKTPPKGLLTGAFYSGMSFTGIELCLLVFPYISSPQKARSGISVAVITVGIVMAVITFITIASFGVGGVKAQLWPVLEIMNQVEVPGSFLERQEALIMSFWIISVFFIVNAYLFFSSLILKTTIKKGSHSTYILLCAAAVFFGSLIFRTADEVEKYMRIVFVTFDVFYMVILPVVLLVVSGIRRVKV